jgi:hypothetical protein
MGMRKGWKISCYWVAALPWLFKVQIIIDADDRGI